MFWLSIASPDSSFTLTSAPNNNFPRFCSNWNRHLELLCFPTNESQPEGLPCCLRSRQAVCYRSYWSSFTHFLIVLSMWVDSVGLCFFFFSQGYNEQTKTEAKQRAAVPRYGAFIHFIHSVCYVRWRAFAESFICGLMAAPIAPAASKAHLKWKKGEKKKQKNTRPLFGLIEYYTLKDTGLQNWMKIIIARKTYRGAWQEKHKLKIFTKAQIHRVACLIRFSRFPA